MKRDPFLNRLLIIIDRLSAWLLLVAASGALLWSLIWQNGLKFSGSEALALFLQFATGNADRATTVIGILTLSNAILLVSLISIWLFRRWQRSGELRWEYLRGARLENDR